MLAQNQSNLNISLCRLLGKVARTAWFSLDRAGVVMNLGLLALVPPVIPSRVKMEICRHHARHTRVKSTSSQRKNFQPDRTDTYAAENWIDLWLPTTFLKILWKLLSQKLASNHIKWFLNYCFDVSTDHFIRVLLYGAYDDLMKTITTGVVEINGLSAFLKFEVLFAHQSWT